jgi:2,3-diketo-5-methylthio-1-phosphopentane phosphatase/HAD superfamily hydrolase (TIGR01549 family)
MKPHCTEQPDHATPKVLILCDFDGTVSTKDTVNRLVRDHVTSPEWRVHVKRYLRGEIGSREVYQAIAPTMLMTREDLEDFVLKHAELDEAFPTFLQWAGSLGIDVKIVSDGFDATILTLFRNHGIQGLEIFANCLALDGDGQVSIDSPYANPDCGRCGTCKLGIVHRFRKDYDKIILVGDGESDRHAAQGADAVVALKELFVYCAHKGIPAVRAEGFDEIPFLLTRRIQSVAFDMDGTLVDSLDSIADAFNHMFSALGYPVMTVDQVVRATSISLRDFVKKFFGPDEGELAVKIFRDYYRNIFTEKTKIMPGAMEALQAIDGTVVKGVITNKRGEYARRLAEHLGFADQMARIIGAEDGFPAKPSADMFAEFIRSAGAANSNTIYVGDAPIDVDAAKNAGIDAFVLAGPIFSGEELALHGPRRVLQRIAELPGALKPILEFKASTIEAKLE